MVGELVGCLGREWCACGCLMIGCDFDSRVGVCEDECGLIRFFWGR